MKIARSSKELEEYFARFYRERRLAAAWAPTPEERAATARTNLILGIVSFGVLAAPLGVVGVLAL